MLNFFVGSGNYLAPVVKPRKQNSKKVFVWDTLLFISETSWLICLCQKHCPMFIVGTLLSILETKSSPEILLTISVDTMLNIDSIFNRLTHVTFFCQRTNGEKVFVFSATPLSSKSLVQKQSKDLLFTLLEDWISTYICFNFMQYLPNPHTKHTYPNPLILKPLSPQLLPSRWCVGQIVWFPELLDQCFSWPSRYCLNLTYVVKILCVSHGHILPFALVKITLKDSNIQMHLVVFLNVQNSRSLKLTNGATMQGSLLWKTVFSVGFFGFSP